MTNNDPGRRAALQTIGGLLAAGCGASGGPAPQAPAVKSAVPPVPPGKPGEFHFLHGEWRIKHRRLKSPGVWDEFEGEATCFTILGGVGSIEELRIPARDFSGSGIRLLDVTTHVWSDYWVNAKAATIGTPGVTGGFVDGVGTFMSEDMDGDKPILARGVWDQITPTSCRWHQAVSRDRGATWEENWIMHWTRVPT